MHDDKKRSQRYVILHHTGGPKPDHFDFMLEANGTLKTWTIRTDDLSKGQRVTQKDDHRLRYLDYEGPVSDERGKVQRVATGTYEVGAWTADRILVRLSGDRSLLLERVSGDEWTLGPPAE